VEAENPDVGAFADALGRAIAELDSERGKAKQFQLQHPEYVVDARGFAERIVGTPLLQSEPPRKPMALWLSNDTRGQGSQAVYDAQIAYLEARGFTVIQIHLPYPNRANADDTVDFDWHVFLESLTWRPGFCPSEEFYRIADAIERYGNSFERFSVAWRHLEVDHSLREFLQSIPFDLVVVNYAHHREVLNTLGLHPTCPIILETHDIQAAQYAIQQKRTVSDAEVRREVRAVEQFDHIVCISATEAKFFARDVGAEKVTWVLPPVTLAIAPNEGPTQPATTDIDVLIVASEHAANLESVRWFLEEVYAPHLYRRGVTLRIVGGVSRRLDRSWMADSVDYADIIPFLDAHYEAARVVALPITSGAGVPIKVLDAFARGTAFSMTRFPAAALDLPTSFPAVATANEMADDIAMLLASSEARVARARTGRVFYLEHAGRSTYFARWDGILRAVGLPIGNSIVPPEGVLAAVQADRNEPRTISPSPLSERISSKKDRTSLQHCAAKRVAEASNAVPVVFSQQSDPRPFDLSRVDASQSEERSANGQTSEHELQELRHLIQHGAGIRLDQMRAIAKEVWWERNRQRGIYKIGKFIKRLIDGNRRNK
jgi:hypothetical protein